MNYDLIVIGSGPAGYVAAARAGQLGLKTACIEKSKPLGGTCLNVGCIPSKALLASSEHYHFAKHRFASHGIVASNISLDLAALMKRKNDVVSQLGKGIEFLFKKNKVDRFEGTGTLRSPKQVVVTGNDGKEQVLETKNILIATGSVPIELPFLKFDGRSVVSSDHAIAFSEVPKSLLVIGAGAIGLELGSVWSRLGSEVTIVEFLPRIATGFDLELATQLQRSLEKQGLKFFLSTQVQSAQAGKGSVTLTAQQDGKKITLEAEKVLVAVGRKPYTAGLGLENAGIKLSEKGRIPVNKNWQTVMPNIYAAGDVIEGPMLAHKAEAEANAIVEHIAGQAGQVNYNAIPGVIYTAPEGASVGLSEEQAREQGREIKTGKYPFMANGRALAGDTKEGFAKIITDAKTDKVLGAHILASNASELIAECVLLMEFGGSAEDLARTIHTHPTMSEVVKEAAHAAWLAH
ncbi:MAG: dihydrolipoyl dehydrogenase [Methylacidiphilales bacterium]|nr:dihydrolipoyl dehydrogenase [Candidatus Methylacidiphilales bacterium]